jgi:acylphosphatase
MKKQARIIVRGVVQGVCYRAYTQEAARTSGLRGYVRNLPNGDVEIVAEGEDEALQRLVDWAKRGPPLAEVEDVRVDYSEPTNAFGDFHIRG